MTFPGTQWLASCSPTPAAAFSPDSQLPVEATG